MTTLNIRPAERQDIYAIGEIAGTTDLFPATLLDDMIAGYLAESTKDIWFVVEVQDDVVAFSFCEPERMTEGTWNLLAIGVQPDQQGAGVGAAMLRYLEKLLADRGERVLIVETMGTPELALTRKFYIKNDYVEEARIREFYEPGADKVVYWKQL